MKKDESTEMRSKVVIDTNIFISALIAKGNPRKILELWGEKRFVLCVNDLIIEEIKESIYELTHMMTPNNFVQQFA